MTEKNNKTSKYSSAAKIALIAAIINLCLAVAEIVLGFYFGILTVVAAGFHYLFDTAFLAITFFSFKFASKPADKEHPYGHERMEYISALFLSAVLLVVSIDIIVEGIGRIISPEAMVLNLVTMIVLIVVILAKVGLALLYYYKNKKLNFLSLKASFNDSIFDSVSASLVLLGLLFAKFTTFSIDGVLSILIAGPMIYNSIKILKVSMDNLIGKKPEKELKQRIMKQLKTYNEISHIHDLLIHNYGQSNLFVSVHVMLNNDFDLEQSKEFLDMVISDFKKDNINIVVQIEGKKLAKNS